MHLLIIVLVAGACCMFLERRYSLIIHTPLSHVSLFKKLAYFSGCLYSLLLILMLLSPKEDIQSVVEIWDPTVKHTMIEKDYARDCFINFFTDFERAKQSVEEILYDPFFLCHFLGYVPFTFLFRDYTTLWIKSVVFELVEISLQHHMGNFKECWWDHYIVDVLVCNAAGIFLGMKLIQWMGFRTFPNIITRKLLQNPWKMLQSMFLIWMLLHNEMMSFYNKYIFNIEAFHSINVARLIIMACFGYAGSQDYYENVILEEKSSTDFWKVVVMISFLEEAFVYKFRERIFTNYTPDYVSLPLQLSTTLFVMWVSLWIFFRKEIEKRKGLCIAMNCLFFASLVPAAALMVYGI